MLRHYNDFIILVKARGTVDAASSITDIPIHSLGSVLDLACIIALRKYFIILCYCFFLRIYLIFILLMDCQIRL